VTVLRVLHVNIKNLKCLLLEVYINKLFSMCEIPLLFNVHPFRSGTDLISVLILLVLLLIFLFLS